MSLAFVGPLLFSLSSRHPNNFILQLPAVLDEADEAGDMALDLSLLGRQLSIAETLLKHGASVTTTDPTGASLLHRAVRRGQFCLGFLPLFPTPPHYHHEPFVKPVFQTGMGQTGSFHSIPPPSYI